MNGGRSLRHHCAARTNYQEAFCLEEAGSSTEIYAATTAGEILCSGDLGDSWKVVVKGLAPISKAGHYRALVQAA